MTWSNPVDVDLGDFDSLVPASLRISRLRATGARWRIGLPAVGICGSRNATEEAISRANRFGHLATKAGLGVVSGNARGVDSSAQLGALQSNGWVTAVLPEGLGGWKPRMEHRPFVNADNLVVVSEYDDAAGWTVGRAMQRNRLIVGLSLALVVVQAGTSGGTFNAGLECLKQRKPLLVVESQTQSPETEGNRQLIARGAVGLTTERELYELLKQIAGRSSAPTTSEQRRLWTEAS